MLYATVPDRGALRSPGGENTFRRFRILRHIITESLWTEWAFAFILLKCGTGSGEMPWKKTAWFRKQEKPFLAGRGLFSTCLSPVVPIIRGHLS